MQILAPLWNPLGGYSLTFCHTRVDFRQSQKRTTGLAWACPVKTKFLSSRRSVHFPNDRINAKPPRLKMKILRAVRLSCSKSKDLLRSEFCNGELCVLRPVYWHLVMVVYHGFCYWLIDLWPIKRYAIGRSADRGKTFCDRYVTGSLPKDEMEFKTLVSTPAFQWFTFTTHIK